MLNLVLVGAGGAVGSVARYLLTAATARAFGTGFPYGTYAANLAGGLLMGLLAGWLGQSGGPEQDRWRLLLAVGVLGGFTTFSAYSLEVTRMIEARAWMQAAFYALSSAVFAVGAASAGLLLARRLFA